jgi:purine-nucleoside phosphorylase
MKELKEIPYEEIPHFPTSTVEGHEGKLIVGKIGDKNVLIMKGRTHYYEGHDTSLITIPIRVFSSLSIKTLIITNACGGIRDDLTPGSLCALEDHISFFAPSPLRGKNLSDFGPRFPDMSDVYSSRLREHAIKCAKELDIDLKTGIYAFFAGPQFETPAEIRAFRTLGADVVGMSTIPEAIVAKHCGMETLAISLITNRAAGLSKNTLSHEDVQKTASKVQKDFVSLLKNIIETL